MWARVARAARPAPALLRPLRPLLRAPPPLPPARACSALISRLTPARAAPARMGLETLPLVGPTRFAVVAMGGSQYKVATDDLICVEKLDLPVGASIAAKRVLLVGERGATIIGSPLVKDASVLMTVEEQGYAKKAIVFKKRRRKGYRRWKGYRARLTLLRVRAVELPESLEAQLRGEAG